MNNIVFSIGSYVKTPNEKLTTVSLNLAKLVELFSRPAIITDKLTSHYFLRCVASYRNNKSVAPSASLLIIDADKRIDWLGDGGELDGSVNPAPVHCCLRDYGINHLIYSSYSNGKIDANGEPLTKWRAVIPCQYARDRLADAAGHIITLLHENQLFVADAKENNAYAQAWFMPCVHPERADFFQFFSFADGDFLDVEAIPATHPALLKETPTPAPCRPLAAPRTHTSTPITAFNETYTVHDVLVRNGYKRAANGKYLSPDSGTKEAGVVVLEDGARIISYHNDALNDGAVHDAWDCYRLLECGGGKALALNWNAELTRQNRREYMKAQGPSQAVRCND